MLYDEIVPDLRYFVCRHCAPGWNMPASTIGFIDLTYVFRGHGTYTVNGVQYPCGPGDLVCIPQGGTRQGKIKLEEPMSLYASNLLLFDLSGRDIQLPFPPHSHIGLREDLLALYHELNTAWVRKRPGYRILVRSLLLRILHLYLSVFFFHDDALDLDLHVKKAMRLIYENSDRDIEVVDLARQIGLNPSYFGTLFHQVTGHTVKDYLNRIRTDHAENLLASGEFSVKEVANRCGFEDHFYFSKVFKRYKGIPPSQVSSLL